MTWPSMCHNFQDKWSTKAMCKENTDKRRNTGRSSSNFTRSWTPITPTQSKAESIRRPKKSSLGCSCWTILMIWPSTTTSTTATSWSSRMLSRIAWFSRTRKNNKWSYWLKPSRKFTRWVRTLRLSSFGNSNKFTKQPTESQTKQSSWSSYLPTSPSMNSESYPKKICSSCWKLQSPTKTGPSRWSKESSGTGFNAAN